MKNIFLFGVFFSAALFAHALGNLPSSQVREKMFQDLAATMTRLDGEALYVRQNRNKSWTSITRELSYEASTANNWPELYRAFQRLNQAYPNLHSNINPGSDLKLMLEKPIRLKVEFQANWTAPHAVDFSVSKVDPDLTLPVNVLPQVGDRVLAINGRDIQEWAKEYFEYCKFPLKEQCDMFFPDQIKKEFLNWNRSQPFVLNLKRGDKIWNVVIPTEEMTSQPLAANEYCKYDSNRYDGFQLVYTGNRLCIFENPALPGTAVMRITSFYYSPGELEAGEKITSVTQEIESIFPWWSAHANWNHLIIDVIDNHGGNASIPYNQILLQHDFQAQYAIYKKTPEMEDPALRRGYFWDSKEQELWFQKLISDGTWASLAINEHTPPVPMFCATENQDCSLGKFSPKPHPFKGQVSVLLNQWCGSSCDAFVYTIKEAFGAKAQFFGQPQAADTAYSRIALHVVLDNALVEGYHLVESAIYEAAPANTILSQTAVVTQSVTANGVILSGKPVPLKVFVPSTIDNKVRWPNAVLSKALKLH